MQKNWNTPEVICVLKKRFLSQKSSSVSLLLPNSFISAYTHQNITMKLSGLYYVGIYRKLTPDWIELTQTWISFRAQYRTKFEILLGEVFQYTSEFKLGIWIFSQARIDLNSQYKFYDVLKQDHTITCTTQSTKQYTRNTFYILFHQVIIL